MSDTDVVQYEAPAASELEQWGRDAHQISIVALRLVKTSFVPASYGGDPAQVVAAILTGQEIGLKPMAALRSIDVISGVPAMRAIAMRALVQSNGHEIWTVESTATQCVVKGQRKGSDKVETSTWTIDRARGLALLGKDNWKKQPIAMLLARATSECARLVAADVLLGVPYSVEEIQDLDPAAIEGAADDAQRKAPASRTTKRKPLAAPADVEEPPLDEDEPAPAESAAEPVPGVAEVPKAEPIGSWPVRDIPQGAPDDDPLPLEEPEVDWEGQMES